MKSYHSLILPEYKLTAFSRLLFNRNHLCDKRFAIYHLSHDDEAVPLAKHIEAVIFKDAFNNDEDTMHREYDVYDKVSEYFVAIDHEKMAPAGVIRIIGQSDAGLKTLTASCEPPWMCNLEELAKQNNIHHELNKIYDVATLAVMPDYRKGNGVYVSFNLYVAIFSFARLNNIEKFTAILDEKPFNLLRKIGVPVDPIKGTDFAPYLGSARSVPAIIHIDDLMSMMCIDHPSVLQIKMTVLFMNRIFFFEKPLDHSCLQFRSLYYKLLSLLIKCLPVNVLSRFYR